MTLHVLSAAVLVSSAAALFLARTESPDEKPPVPEVSVPHVVLDVDTVVPGPVPAFVERGLSWLAEAQHEDGGWGGGSHANQGIRDPHAVPTDPGTSAFTAMAFLRAGHTSDAGRYRETVRRATTYLLDLVEAADEDGPKVTDVSGTQPQAKMGPYVDTALCAQFFARALAGVDEGSALAGRLAAARDKCLRKIEATQQGDGSWGRGGWAPVLQSSLMSSALELGAASGGEVGRESLDRAREYQMGQVDTETGAVAGEAAAGVALYAAAGNMRAVAAKARQAEDLVEEAKRDGRVDGDAEVDEDALVAAGVKREEARLLALGYLQSRQAKERAFDDELLKGFGNNGGEEFLSYLMSAESLVIDGGEEWRTWNEKMRARLERIQNGDGSWSGHHCITSPVFCTAAVALCVTADRDVQLLREASRVASDGGPADVDESDADEGAAEGAASDGEESEESEESDGGGR